MWVRADEAMMQTGLSQPSLCNYVKKGRLHSKHEGRYVFYRQDDIDRLIREREGRHIRRERRYGSVQVEVSWEYRAYLDRVNEEWLKMLPVAGREQVC